MCQRRPHQGQVVQPVCRGKTEAEHPRSARVTIIHAGWRRAAPRPEIASLGAVLDGAVLHPSLAGRLKPSCLGQPAGHTRAYTVEPGC